MIFILIVLLFIDETKETVIRPQKQHKKQNTFYQTVSLFVKRFSYA